MKRAVIVGDNHFPRAPGNDLLGCIPDEQHLLSFLLHLGGFSLAPATDAGKKTEWGLLTALCQAPQPGDYLFYGHSSHGGLLADGMPFLATSDIRPRGDDWDPASIIAHTELHALIAALPAGVLFEAVIDACYCQDMERELGRTYGRSKYVAHPARALGEPTIAALCKALTPQPANAVLWAACRSDETAADGGASGGVFTTAFIACYKPGQSRRDHMAAIAALIKGQGYPQVPQLLCSDALMGKAFGDF